MLRSKNIDTLGNSGYSVINGQNRQSLDIPKPPGSSGSNLAKAGAAVFGDGYAGRPIRGMDKEFGKKVNTEYQPSMGS